MISEDPTVSKHKTSEGKVKGNKGQKSMEASAVESIAARLSAIDGLYFPRSVEASSLPPSHRKVLLLDLLTREPPIFLERYGPHLTPAEIQSFETLAGDYSVRFHLDRLRSLLDPTPDEIRSRSAKIKNRRRAYLEELVKGGEYFSEDAMREREPYLHHQMVGRFQDPMGRVMSRPGERWSETLMRRCQEAAIVEKIREEQRRRGVDRSEWVGGGDEEEEEMEEVESEESEESEEEEEEEEEGEEEERAQPRALGGHGDQESNGHLHVTVAEPSEPFEPSISPNEMQDKLDQFTQIMQEKFLAGEDTDHLDYSRIDADESLDDHWYKEATQDAEDKYFDED